MATSSISGLASGLDTATIVDQLMQLEAAPQTRLQSRVNSEKSLLTTLQGLNTKTTLLGGKAETLAKPATWAPLTATSSSGNVVATTSTGAGPTRLSITIGSVARSHQLGFADTAGLTDQVTGASTTVRLDRLDGTGLDLETGDGTLSGLAAAINDAGNATGLRASLVKVAEGGYRLLVESATTGAASDFALTAADGSALLGGAAVRAGTDAALDLGLGITVTSPTNTFTDVLPGVSLTLGAGATAGETATVTVARDTGKLTTAVAGLVDAVNGLLSDIDSQTAFNAATSSAGRLAGDSTVRSLRSALLNSVYPADGTSLAALGIEVTRDGKLKLDSAKLAAAYEADPEGVAARFNSTGNGFAQRVADVAKTASDTVTGTLSSAIQGRQSSITRMQDSIGDWDNRLELRRTTLQRQFTALETALGAMTSQSNWLAGQLASLPKYE